ncbi:MAG: DHHA1 domain-containing protein [Candidatus Thorarchaeota archaeon]|jgi:RecJ-like exonuclease
MMDLPPDMESELKRAAECLKNAKQVLALSHIDADGITSMAIVVETIKRLGKPHIWRNIHQLNSESINEVIELVEESSPDVVIFSDFGSGQIHLIIEHIVGIESIDCIVVLDHHIPPDDRATLGIDDFSGKLIEINPCQHGLSGSKDISGAGVSFLFSMAVSQENANLSELAIVGATGDLQDYYGKGFTGLNSQILEFGVSGGFIKIDKDLTLFGINTRPLPQLLQYATDPYIPGLTGDPDACYYFYSDLGIELKDREDQWKRWVDLTKEEKQKVIQKLFAELLQLYNDPRVAKNLVGDVVSLLLRPPRSEMSTAKEFSTLLNACGRNRRSDIGVKICLGDDEAFQSGKALLQQHRANLAMAIRRIEDGGYQEKPGAYIVNDPETQDTIIGIVIGMAQGSRIIPEDKPVIGISTNTSDDGSMVKLSGRARQHIVKRGVNLKEVFSEIAEEMNTQYDTLVAEAGGHPMAAGAFVQNDHLEEFVEKVSSLIAQKLQ